ncbi:polyadenylate-binding protein [Nematocida sp. AWRm80]|nr:polyadenylate-binding protein [Nematocida sp. AWRm80]
MQSKEINKQENIDDKLDEEHSIYVGDLPLSVTETDLFTLFKNVGEIYKVQITKRDSNIIKNTCFGQVSFFNKESVKLAIENYNFSMINGTQIRVMPLNKSSVVGNRPGNIIIKNLPKEMDNQSLYDTFIIFGKILSCKTQKNIQGECTGAGFVQFESPKVAQMAIEMINKISMKGVKLVAVQCIPNSQREKKTDLINKTFTNLYMKNFPSTVSEKELQTELEKYGKLTSFFSPKTPEGYPKGFAFANYETNECAVAAIEGMHGKPFPGQPEGSTPFYIQRAKLKDERQAEVIEDLLTKPEDKESKKNIYIINLPGDVNEEEFLEYFGRFGNIVSHRVEIDKKNSRGYAYVSYEQKEQGIAAVEQADKADFRGWTLDVTFFRHKLVRDLEKANRQVYNMYKDIYNPSKPKKKPITQEEMANNGYDLYLLILSLAPTYREKIEKAGFQTEEEFAKKITGMILELGPEESQTATMVGNVLSQYVEESLEELISHRVQEQEKSTTEEHIE